MTGLVSVLYLALAVLLWRERTGRRTLVGRLADAVGRLDGVPRWAALTPYLHVASLLAAAFGVWWDIAVHIDTAATPARSARPRTTRSSSASSWPACCRSPPARQPLPARTLKLTKGWRIPPSAALITVCGTFSLVGFPMDDMWHRLFGEDVTLWGPTHLMIGGAVFSIFGRLLALAEIEQLMGLNLRRRLQEIICVGALLIAWDLFSTEFNYGVPQFPLILHPILIVFGAAMAFTLLRSRRGPGSTFGALAVYLVIRGVIAWTVDQPLGEILGHFPLLIAEAVLVEAVALGLGNKFRFRLGAVAGALIGTVGVVAEYLWSQVWMPIPWPSSILPSALGFGLVVGVGAGLVGAWLATRLAEVAGEVQTTPPVHRTHQFGAVGLVAVLAMLFFCVPRTADPGVTGTVSLERVATDSEPTAYVTVKLQPADAAEGARWFEAMSWQGGGHSTNRMLKVADGTYRSTEPLPMYGKWKSLIRLHQGQRDMVAMWIYAPEDAELHKPTIQISDGQTGDFISEQLVLRREERTDVPRWMWNGSMEILGIAWLVGRGARGGRLRAAHLAEVAAGKREREIA